MQPTFVKTEDAALEKAENEVAAALFHKTALLRFKNWLRSPLLRLPAEILTNILSYIMEDMEHPHVWRPTFSTCHRIHTIMCTTTELWRKANFTLDKSACLALKRSMGNIREITADFQASEDRRNEWTRFVMGFCRDNLVLRGDNLHTVDLRGSPSDLISWSWIFKRPLPRLRDLKIHFAAYNEADTYSLRNPVALELPTDLSLRVLDLRNATLPWSSDFFTGLRELHLAFDDCDTYVEISEDELLGILEASPQLERLSLESLTPRIPIINGQLQYTPVRIARLPRLTSLKLDNLPEHTGYILAHMNIPAITSFEIRSQLSFQEVEQDVKESLDLFFPDNHIPNRLFPNPPVFEVLPDSINGTCDSLMINIGSAKIQFEYDMDLVETSCNAIMTCIYPLVPSSVTTLRLGYSNLSEVEWEVFFLSHPEIRSIEFMESARDPMSDSLWGALSPVPDAVPLCPYLESISVFDLAPTSLLDCLRNRKNAGFGIRHLKLWGVDVELVGEFRPLVGELQALSKPVHPLDKVRLVSMDELDIC